MDIDVVIRSIIELLRVECGFNKQFPEIVAGSRERSVLTLGSLCLLRFSGNKVKYTTSEKTHFIDKIKNVFYQ